MMDLYGHPLWAIFLVGLSLIWIVTGIGQRLGKRVAAKGGDRISTLESAMLGLLSLIIGFTFAMALDLFQARRDAVINEANAINIMAHRALLLSGPQRTESLKLLQEYAEIRVVIVDHEISPQEFHSLIDRSNAIQEALWQQATEIAAKDKNGALTRLFIQALDTMIDTHGKRMAAARNRVPYVVVLSLFGLAAVACGFAGYGSGLDTRRNRLPVYIFGLLVAIVILLILDLDRPRNGFIMVSQQPIIDIKANIGAFTHSPKKN